MFLALFPFSEVIYIIAMFLAWVYIAFGIYGNAHVTKTENAASNKTIHVGHQTQATFTDDRTCHWNEIDNNSMALVEEPLKIFVPIPDIVFKFLKGREVFQISCLLNNLPNRAPPII